MEIQLNSRNYTQLIVLTPGSVARWVRMKPKIGVLGSVSYSVNGGRTDITASKSMALRHLTSGSTRASIF